MSLIRSASPRLFGWLAEASLFCVYILFVVQLVSYDSLEVFLILSFYSGFSSQDCCVYVVYCESLAYVCARLIPDKGDVVYAY